MPVIQNMAIATQWDACAPLWHLSFVQASPPEVGIETHRKTVQISWREIAEPEVPQQLQLH